MLLRIIEPGLPPELPGDLNGIDAGRLPPGLLVAGAMDGAVMRAAERDGEFVAGLAAERPRLQVAKMMRIGLFAAADKTCLLGDITQRSQPRILAAQLSEASLDADSPTQMLSRSPERSEDAQDHVWRRLLAERMGGPRDRTTIVAASSQAAA